MPWRQGKAYLVRRLGKGEVFFFFGCFFSIIHFYTKNLLSLVARKGPKENLKTCART